MQYFKHAELAAKYHVSLKTVHNWIEAAKHGKGNLKLHTHNGRTYIANTPENTTTLARMSESGKKYRNTIHHKDVYPEQEFYDTFSNRQILDIITNLNVYGEIPRQYNYFKNGATNWDNWLKRLAGQDHSNILTGTIELIDINLSAIERLLEGKKKINVIDLGAGNAYPVKDLLSYLLKKGILNRYIAIDISESMLAVAKDNTRKWFGDEFNFEGYVRDMSFERFDDLIVEDMLEKDARETINLVLLLGATPGNFRSTQSIYKTVHDSMGDKDLLLYTGKPDTETARRYFDFNSSSEPSKLSPNHKYILDILNIDADLYDVEMGYDQIKRMRYIRVRLLKSLTLHFSAQNIERSLDLEKGDTILLLRVWHQTAVEIISDFDNAGFTLLQSSLTKDRQYFLSISGVQAKQSLEP